jgi:hypothetical protein
MEIIVTIIIEVIYMTLLNSIGAFMRSLFTKKKTFKDLLDDKPFLNAVLAILLIGGIVCSITLLI